MNFSKEPTTGKLEEERKKVIRVLRNTNPILDAEAKALARSLIQAAKQAGGIGLPGDVEESLVNSGGKSIIEFKRRESRPLSEAKFLVSSLVEDVELKGRKVRSPQKSSTHQQQHAHQVFDAQPVQQQRPDVQATDDRSGLSSRLNKQHDIAVAFCKQGKLREIVLDTETTGLDTGSGHRIIEIGCVELINHIPTGKVFHRYINPERNISKGAFKVHGISEEFLKDKPLFSEVAPEFLDFISSDTLVIHNATFDIKFLNMELGKLNAELISSNRVLDTLSLAKKKFPGLPASLSALCKHFDISLENRELHGALIDAQLLAKVYVKLTGGLQTFLNQCEQDNNSTVIQHKVRNLSFREHSPNNEKANKQLDEINVSVQGKSLGNSR